MAVVATEIFSQSEAGSSQSNGARTVVRRFHITGTDVRETALDAAELPSVGDTQTLDGETATYSGTKSWTRVDGHEDLWEADFEYTTAPGSSTATIETMGSTRATTKAVFRIGKPFARPRGGWDEPQPEDLGGYAIDQGGTPTSIVHIDRTFETIERILLFPQVGAYSNLVGKRNNAWYEGGEVGTILYLGFSWNYDTTSGLWVLRHQFAVDKRTYHAEQVATTDSKGEPLTEMRGEENNARFVASKVYWVQPFPLASFDALPDFP